MIIIPSGHSKVFSPIWSLHDATFYFLLPRNYAKTSPTKRANNIILIPSEFKLKIE